MISSCSLTSSDSFDTIFVRNVVMLDCPGENDSGHVKSRQQTNNKQQTINAFLQVTTHIHTNIYTHILRTLTHPPRTRTHTYTCPYANPAVLGQTTAGNACITDLEEKWFHQVKTYADIHRHAHTYTHTHTHTHTRTHTHTCTFSRITSFSNKLNFDTMF